MNQRRQITLALLSLLGAPLWSAISKAGEPGAAATGKIKDLPPAAATTIAGDESDWDAIARLLAGLPTTNPRYAAAMALPSWLEHAAAMQPAWQKLHADRLKKITAWRNQQLTRIPATAPLLYPFGGPDLLNAIAFFPLHPRYFLMGLEPVGEVPEIAQFTEAKAKKFYPRLRASLGDLVERNYFITSHMQQQLNQPTIKGVLPVLLATIAGMGLEVLTLHVQATTKTVEETKPIPSAVITFRRPDARQTTQTVSYFSFDASDKAIAERPQVVGLITSIQRQYGTTVTFLKSASYLLHGPYFLRFRDAIMAATGALVQDDTGIPYRLLPAAEWQTSLYGEYRPPVRDFGRFGYQPDLERVYRKQDSAPLPFPFGYHWKNSQSNLLVATRIPR